MGINIFALLYLIVIVALIFLFLYVVIRFAVSSGVQHAVKKLKDQGLL